MHGGRRHWGLLAGVVVGPIAIFSAASSILQAGTASPGAAQKKSESPSSTASSAKTGPAKTRPAKLAPEREDAAISFAREQHPELAALIEKLRKDNGPQFETAIRQLAQDRERLLRLQKQSSALYELGLAGWKLDSRAKLLAARMTMSQDAALESELRQIVIDRVEIRLKELQFQRDRSEERLAQLNRAIQQIEADKAAAANRDLQRIKRSVAKNRRPAPTKPAPAITIRQSKSGDSDTSESPRGPGTPPRPQPEKVP